MTQLKAFYDLELLEREKQAVQFSARTNQLTDLEYQRKIAELDSRQSELRHSAASELRTQREQLAKLHKSIAASAERAAEAHARTIDYARLDAAHKQAQRLLSRAKSAQDINRVLQEARASGDKHLQRAVFEQITDAVLAMKPGRLGPDEMRRIELKNQIAPELEKLLYSDEQRAIMAQKQQADELVVAYVQEVSRAKAAFRPPAVAYGSGVQPDDVFRGLTDGISLAQHAENPMLVDVEFADATT